MVMVKTHLRSWQTSIKIILFYQSMNTVISVCYINTADASAAFLSSADQSCHWLIDWLIDWLIVSPSAGQMIPPQSQLLTTEGKNDVSRENSAVDFSKVMMHN